MPSDLSSLPNYPTPDPPEAGRDKGLSSAERSDEPLRQSSTVVLYGLALGWICLFGLPLFVFSFQAGPVAVVGAILLLGSEVWLFTQIFAGNPAVALVVLLIPILGPLLALQFIIDHWSIARWPVLCQLIGLPVWFCGWASHMGP